MSRFRSIIVVGALLASSTQAQAALVTLPFSGVLTAAENVVFDDPDIPQGNFFFVGQAFSGSVTYDTDLAADFEEDGQFIVFPLVDFDLFFGTTDFSDRFFARSLGRSADGSLDFTSGGAGQGGGANLSVDIGSFAPAYPTLAQLSGKSAFFSYNDFQPLGGSVSGPATIAAVPEPASWALMIGGFGMIGAALRRRPAPAQVRVRFG